MQNRRLSSSSISPIETKGVESDFAAEKLTIEFKLEQFITSCQNFLQDATEVQTYLLEKILPKLKKDIDQVNRLAGEFEHQQEALKLLLRTIQNNHCDPRSFSGLQKVHHRLGLSIAGGILRPIALQCQKLLKILDKPILERERQKNLLLDTRYQAAEQILSEEIRELTVHAGKTLPENINQIVSQMGEYLRAYCPVPQGCYIVYGWSLEEHAKRELWVRDGLKLLKSHLEHAGINTIHLDVESNPLGGAVKTYMEQTETDDYILMIGTQSAFDKQKYSGGTAAICTEMILAKRKQAKDIKQGLRRVVPILLTHDMERSFPPEYEGYNTVRDWRIAGYLENLKELIFTLYGLDKQNFYKSYQEKWDELEKQSSYYNSIHQFKHSFQERRKAILAVGLNRDASDDSSLTQGFESKREHKESDIKTETWRLPLYNQHLFVGREVLLAKLRHQFESHKTNHRIVLNAISGLGGVGKTTLAAHYIHQAEHYRLRIWFQAENAALLQTDYREFAKKFNLLLPEDKTPAEEVCAVVKAFLEQRTDWLAVYDNAGDYNKLASYLPNKGGHLIVTTRKPEWGDVGSKLDVDIFSQEEALTYLNKIIEQADVADSKREIDKATLELVELLGRLPLALAQAGAYIKKRGISVGDYLTRYKTQSTDLLADKLLPLGSLSEPVATTWHISLKAIADDEQKAGEPPLALSLLQAVAYLHPEQIPRDLLELYLQRSGLATNAQVARRKTDLAIGHLLAYSLIQTHPHEKTVSLHRLVQMVVRNWYQEKKGTMDTPYCFGMEEKNESSIEEKSTKQMLLGALADSLVKEFDEKTDIVDDGAYSKMLLPHLQAMVCHLEQTLHLFSSLQLDNKKRIIQIYFLLGKIHYIFFDFKLAEDNFEKADKICNSISSNSRDILCLQSELLFIYGKIPFNSKEEYNKYLPILEKSLSKRKEYLDGKEKDAIFFDIERHIGCLYIKINPEMAEEHFKNLLKLKEDICQIDKTLYGQVCVNYAHLMYYKKNFLEANVRLNEAVSILSDSECTKRKIYAVYWARRLLARNISHPLNVERSVSIARRTIEENITSLESMKERPLILNYELAESYFSMATTCVKGVSGRKDAVAYLNRFFAFIDKLPIKTKYIFEVIAEAEKLRRELKQEAETNGGNKNYIFISAGVGIASYIIYFLIQRYHIQKVSKYPPPVDESFLPTAHFKNLMELFTAGAQWIAITGVPGSGKTELAKYYAGTLQEGLFPWFKSSPLLIYLEASSELSLSSELERVSNNLNLPRKSIDEKWGTFFPRISQAIADTLRNYPNSLIILNNVNTYQEVEPLLNAIQVGTTRLLLTSWEMNFFIDNGRSIRNLQISAGMTIDEGVQLLKNIWPEIREEGLADFVCEMEGLPLALSLVGIYMRREKIVQITDYQAQAKKRAASYYQLRQDLKGLARKKPYYKDTIHTALLLPIEKIASQDKEAFELLLFASVLHSEGIAHDFFQDYLQIKYPDDLAVKRIGDTLSNSVTLIKGQGLLKTEYHDSQNSNKKLYNMHRLVQEEIREYYYGTHVLGQVAPTQLPLLFKRMMHVLQKHLPESTLEIPVVAEPLLMHLDSILNHTVSLVGELPDEDLAEAYGSAAKGYHYLGTAPFLHKAISYNEKALSIFQALSEGVKASISLNNLAHNYQSLGGANNLQQAVSYLLDSLRIRENRLNATDPLIATSLNNLGVTYLSLGGGSNLIQAMDYLQQSLGIRDKQLGIMPRNVAVTLNNLGMVHLKLGKIGNLMQAINYYFQRALDIGEKQLEAMHLNVADVLNNLGDAHRSLGGVGNLTQAKSYYNRSWSIRKEQLRCAHPLRVQSLHNLGNLGSDYQALGGADNLQQAIDCFQQALKICEKCPEEMHMDIAILLNNIGNAYRDLGGTSNLQQAISYLEQAKEWLKARQPDVAYPLHNLGLTFHALGGIGSLQRAINYFQQALDIWENHTHPMAVNTRAGLLAAQNGLAALQKGNLLSSPKKLPETSSAFPRISVPFWIKPLGWTMSLAKSPFNAVRTFYTSIASSNGRLEEKASDIVVGSVVSTVSSQISNVAPRIVMNTEAATEYKTTTGYHLVSRSQEMEGESEPFRITPSSRPLPAVSAVEVAQVAIPLVGKLCKEYGFFSYKSLTHSSVAHHKKQYAEQLQEIGQSLQRLKTHPIIGRRSEYRVACEIFDQASRRFKNCFLKGIAPDTVTQSENTEVARFIEQAQKASTSIETWQKQLDEIPSFRQAVISLEAQQQVLVDKWQAITRSFKKVLRHLKNQQEAITQQLLDETITPEREKILGATWEQLEAKILAARKQQEVEQPAHDTVDYLLGKTAACLESGCLPEQIESIKEMLKLAETALSEIAQGKASKESPLLVSLINRVDGWREVEGMAAYTQFFANKSVAVTGTNDGAELGTEVFCIGSLVTSVISQASVSAPNLSLLGRR